MTPRMPPNSDRKPPRIAARSAKGRRGLKVDVSVQDSIEVAPEISPIFVHTSFRTGSTWLWLMFRQNSAVHAYCEIFHEILETLTVEEIPRIKSSSWRSRHPESSPYFVEFFDLLRASGGAEGFSPDMAFKAFVPAGGVNGSITSEEVEYVRSLIAAPVSAGRVPVLTDNRTLARAASLKSNFGGLHIFAYRNLFQQWNSYSSQHKDGNRYFLDTIKLTIEHSEHINFFKRLKDFLVLRPEVDERDWLERCNYDDIFVAFVSMHLYLYIVAFDVADLVIDIGRLARDRFYSRDIEGEIRQYSGIEIDLSSAKTTIEAALKPISDPEGVAFKIEVFLRHSIDELGPSEKAIDFARNLLAEMWEEHGRYTFYTRAIFQELDVSGLTRPSEASETSSSLSTRIQELEKELVAVRVSAEKIIADAASRSQVTIADYINQVSDLNRALEAGDLHSEKLSLHIEYLNSELERIVESKETQISRLASLLEESEYKSCQLSEQISSLDAEISNIVELNDNKVSSLELTLEASIRNSNQLSKKIESIEAALRHAIDFNERTNLGVELFCEEFSRVEAELVERNITTQSKAEIEALSGTNDANSKIEILGSLMEQIANVLMQERLSLEALGERKVRDQHRINLLLTQRREMLEQKDALLDVLSKIQTRHRYAMVMNDAKHSEA